MPHTRSVSTSPGALASFGVSLYVCRRSGQAEFHVHVDAAAKTVLSYVGAAVRSGLTAEEIEDDLIEVFGEVIEDVEIRFGAEDVEVVVFPRTDLPAVR